MELSDRWAYPMPYLYGTLAYRFMLAANRRGGYVTAWNTKDEPRGLWWVYLDRNGRRYWIRPVAPAYGVPPVFL
jgi:hypothetical protein